MYTVLAGQQGSYKHSQLP